MFDFRLIPPDRITYDPSFSRVAHLVQDDDVRPGDKVFVADGLYNQ